MSAGEYNPNWWAQAQQQHGLELAGQQWQTNAGLYQAQQGLQGLQHVGRLTTTDGRCDVPGCFVCARTK